MANENDDWKPSGRPQSTMARNFSASLNNAFAIDSKLDGLIQSVEQKKQAVNSQSQELQALEARLRETEERLIEQQSRTSSPAGRGANGTSSPHRRQPLSRAFSGQENDRQSPTTHLLPTQASAPQAVSSSTMSRWRPSQGASSEIHSGTTRTAPFDRQSVYQHSPPSN